MDDQQPLRTESCSEGREGVWCMHLHWATDSTRCTACGKLVKDVMHTGHTRPSREEDPHSAKGRTGDCPGPPRETSERHNVTPGGSHRLLKRLPP